MTLWMTLPMTKQPHSVPFVICSRHRSHLRTRPVPTPPSRPRPPTPLPAPVPLQNHVGHAPSRLSRSASPRPPQRPLLHFPHSPTTRPLSLRWGSISKTCLHPLLTRRLSIQLTLQFQSHPSPATHCRLPLLPTILGNGKSRGRGPDLTPCQLDLDLQSIHLTVSPQLRMFQTLCFPLAMTASIGTLFKRFSLVHAHKSTHTLTHIYTIYTHIHKTGQLYLKCFLSFIQWRGVWMCRVVDLAFDLGTGVDGWEIGGWAVPDLHFAIRLVSPCNTSHFSLTRQTYNLVGFRTRAESERSSGLGITLATGTWNWNTTNSTCAYMQFLFVYTVQKSGNQFVINNTLLYLSSYWASVFIFFPSSSYDQLFTLFPSPRDHLSEQEQEYVDSDRSSSTLRGSFFVCCSLLDDDQLRRLSCFGFSFLSYLQRVPFLPFFSLLPALVPFFSHFLTLLFPLFLESTL